MKARYNLYCDEIAYRFYVTEGLRVISENVVRPGKEYLSKTFNEVLNPSREEQKTGEEIAAEVIQKTGIKLK